MALILVGKTKCPLCGNILEDKQETVSFSPFVSNELDPLWPFSDAALHSACFDHHPLWSEAIARHEEMRKKTAPGNRACVVCKAEIEDPDDYFGLGYFVSNPRDPLYHYNYTEAHESCLPNWSEVSHLYRLLRELKQSGQWKGSSLDETLLTLRETCEGGVASNGT